jgi:hypothetical protein
MEFDIEQPQMVQSERCNFLAICLYETRSRHMHVINDLDERSVEKTVGLSRILQKSSETPFACPQEFR